MAKGDPKAHQLYKQLGATYINLNYGSTADAGASNGWEVLWNTFPYAVNRTYIDLAGWSKQDLTTFTQGVDVQIALMPRAQTEGIAEITCLDLITTRRLTDAEINDWAIPAIGGDPPGFLDNTVDLMEVIYGERTTFAQNTNISAIAPNTIYVILDRETFGSGNPTAMDKLHWTRVYWLNGTGDTELILLPAANLVVQAMTLEEKDLVWMERLRRSYVLQGEL
jgi:hypothetical protein